MSLADRSVASGVLSSTRNDVASCCNRAIFAWTSLAVGSLGFAGLFALLLAISRVPGVERLGIWPIDFFHKGLVIHVVFSFIVWFLAAFALMATLATEHLTLGKNVRSGLGVAAAWGAGLSLPLLFLPAFLDRGEATLNNYVPTIIDPLYYEGLAILAVAILMAVIRPIIHMRRPLEVPPPVVAVTAASMTYILALVCFGLAFSFLDGQTPSHAFNEELFWGGGHELQAVNTLLLVAVWSTLAGHVPGAKPVARLPQWIVIVLVTAMALPPPFFYVLFEPFSAEHTEAFTQLKFGLGQPMAILAFAIGLALPRPLSFREPACLGLILSMVLFFTGGVLGLFVDGTDTRTPAHYHGVIAGVTLGVMTVIYVVVLPRLGRALSSLRSARVQLHIFAWGQLAACIGLFVAGGYGAPRKTAGDAQGLYNIWEKVGMGLNGLGGLVAVVGGIIFVWLVGSALLRPMRGEASPPAATWGNLS